MPNHNTISEEEFSVKLRHAVKYTGYVEGVGYAEWLPVPRTSNTPAYPHDGRMFPKGSSFMTTDYALLITPIEQTVTEKDILEMIVQKNADGSKIVNMGKSDGIEKLSPAGKVTVKIDTVSQHITIRTHDINISKGGNNSRSVSYSFKQFAYEYPVLNRSVTFNAEGGASINTQEVLSQASKVAYIAGIITAEVNRHMGTVQRFRPIVDGWGKVYRATSRWRYSIIPGNMASKIAGMAKPVAGVGAGITLLSDYIGALTWDENPNHPNAIHPAKGALNLFFSVIGFTSFGVAPSVLYFGIDTFYPGGWKKYLIDQSEYYRGNPYMYHK